MYARERRTPHVEFRKYIAAAGNWMETGSGKRTNRAYRTDPTERFMKKETRAKTTRSYSTTTTTATTTNGSPVLPDFSESASPKQKPVGFRDARKETSGTTTESEKTATAEEEDVKNQKITRQRRNKIPAAGSKKAECEGVTSGEERTSMAGKNRAQR